MKPWTAARNGPRRLQIDFRHSKKNLHPAGFSRLRHWFQCVYFMNAVNAAVKSSLQCTWIFLPCRFLDGLRAWNFSTPNLFHPLTQILDPGNFGWFVILPLGGGFDIYTYIYIYIKNNQVPIAPALRCQIDQRESRGGRISVPQCYINIFKQL